MSPCAPIAQACSVNRRIVATSLSPNAMGRGAVQFVQTSPTTTYRDGGDPTKIMSKPQFGARAGTSTAAVALVKPACTQPAAKQAIITADGTSCGLMFLDKIPPTMRDGSDPRPCDARGE